MLALSSDTISVAFLRRQPCLGAGADTAAAYRRSRRRVVRPVSPASGPEPIEDAARRWLDVLLRLGRVLAGVVEAVNATLAGVRGFESS